MSTPQHFKKLSVVTLSKDFRGATKVVEGTLPEKPAPGHVHVKVSYAGVNASDLNFTNGAYFAERAPPFDCGFEGLGTVVALGEGVSALQEGQAVAFSHYGSFAEYVAVPAAACVPVPALQPEYLVIIVSGMTAAVALGEAGRPQRGQVALVTTAAGGTGQIAVQLLKHHYGCTVIGTCSSAEKVEFVKSLGCDHVINYKTENLDERLKELAPNGLNLVYECVGGETFNTAVRNMAPRGRVIVIGAISTYKSGESVPFHDPATKLPLTSFLFVKSISLEGFSLLMYDTEVPQYTKQLLELVGEKKIRLPVDKTPFEGVAAVPDAMDHLYSGTSYGKIVVKIQ